MPKGGVGGVPAHGAAVGARSAMRKVKASGQSAAKQNPFATAAHQINVCRYVAAHGKRGAAVFIHPAVETC